MWKQGKMRNWRQFIMLTVVGGVLAIPTTAVAVPYPAPPSSVTVSQSTVTVGGVVVFAATGGFIPGESIAIDVRYASGNTAARRQDTSEQQDTSDVGSPMGQVVGIALPTRQDQTVTANADGGFSATVRLARIGIAVLTATGMESGVSVSLTVTVLAEAAAADDLPVTGSSGLRLALQVGAGALAIFVGTLLIWLVADRRRRAARI